MDGGHLSLPGLAWCPVLGRESGLSGVPRGFGVPLPILEPDCLLLCGPHRRGVQGRVAKGPEAGGRAGKCQWAGGWGRGYFNGIQGLGFRLRIQTWAQWLSSFPVAPHSEAQPGSLPWGHPRTAWLHQICYCHCIQGF